MATGTSTDPHDIALINRAAAKPPLAPELEPSGTPNQMPNQMPNRMLVRWVGNGIDAVLSLVARDLIALCASPLDARVRICENATCGSPFLDTSRAGDRRWCSMSTCGALSKKRAYRARLRSNATK
jgi:predicted RNA-binding Zn ribbon-like protein